MRAPASACLFCETTNEPRSVRKYKGGQVARYVCCGVLQRVWWPATAVGEAA